MIGNELKKVMEKRNLHSSEVYKAAGMTPQAFSNIKLNKSEPSLKVLKKLADVLICSTDELLGRS